MKKLWILLLLVLLTGCASKQSYVNGNVSPSQIVPALLFSDVNPDNSGQIITIYNRQKLNNDGHGTTFDVEHIFISTKLPNEAARRDLYNLRPCKITINNSRGSLKFVDKPDGGTYGLYNGGWYPGDEDKGDVARALMYMAKTYDLKLSDMISPKLALKWHQDDPVDSFERKRANVIEAIQGNENPFIENKDLAKKVYGEKNYTWLIIIGLAGAGFVTFYYVSNNKEALKKWLKSYTNIER
jgi:hypothetical protein